LNFALLSHKNTSEACTGTVSVLWTWRGLGAVAFTGPSRVLR